MSERVIRDGIGIALALAFCVSAAVGLEAKSPVVVTGLYSASWLKWAKEEKILAEAAAWETECPVAALEGRHLVVFAYAKPKTPLTPQENAAIHKWLEQGGMLILTSGSPAAIAGKTDLSALTWLGANQYVYGKVQNTMLTPENPLVKGMAEDALKATEFCSNQPNLGSLTTAAALIGTDKTANVLLNRVGKGWVLFVSMPPFLGQKSAEGGPALRAIVERFVKAALGGTEERAALARGMPDLKRPAVRVRGRDRVACIVTEQAGAGQRLAKLIEQMTGARAPVVKTPPSGDPFCIHVGPTEFAKRHDLPPQGLHPFGYVFKLVDADNLVIAPARPNVADHAALMFLHHYAGYRWFAPGELGEVIPKVATIALPDRIDDRVEPSFTSWVNAGMYYADGPHLMGWRQTLAAGHNFTRILPPEKFGHEPDRYCMVDGKRFVPPPKLGGTWQPCVSHPDLPRVTVDWAKDFFAKNPEMIGFSANLNDGGGDCQCPACDEKARQFGNRYLPYYNETARLLAQEAPGKMVDIIAYGGSHEAPKNIQPEPNIFVMLCQPFKDNDRVLKDWAAAGARNIGIYQYLYGGGYMVPRHYPRLLGEKWKQARKDFGIIGGWIETVTVCWLYDGPRQYVLNRLTWDIGADIEALLDDYFTKFYIAAAKPMKDFFDRIEEIHRRKKDPFDFYRDWRYPPQLDEYTQADLDHLDGKLGEAGRLAKDELARKRVAVFTKLWALSRLDVLARVRMKELRTLGEVNPPYGGQVARMAAEACRAFGEKAAYTMTPWEESNALTPKMPLAEFKATVQQEPDVETAMDEALEKVWDAFVKAGRRADAERFFTDLAQTADTRRLAALARTRIFLAKRGKPENLTRNSSFEEGRKGEPSADEAAFLKRYDWSAFQPADWSVWHFPQSVTRFYWDESVARTGKRSVAVGRNQIMGCFQQHVPVKPGERYRFTAWAKQKSPKDVLVTVRWVNAKGWRDQGPNRVPTVRVHMAASGEDWRPLTATFTVPDDVTHAVTLLNAPRQHEGDTIWFDDVTLERILEVN